MAWTAHDSKTYSAAIGETEDFYVKFCNLKANQREHWTIYLNADLQISSQLRESVFARVRSAWIALRFQQPNIATTLDSDSKRKLYNVPTADELQQWADETCVQTHDPIDVEAVLARAGHSPLPQVFYLVHSQTLVIQASHWRIDGIGILMLMNSLLALIAQPPDPSTLQWGSEVANLTLPFENALNVPQVPDAAADKYADDVLQGLLARAPSIGVRYAGSPDTPPQATHRAALAVAPATTQALIEAARARGVTVTDAVRAALVLASRDHAADATRDRDYIALAPFDLRRRVAAPHSTATHACNVYHGGGFAHASYSAQPTFDALAQHLRAQTRAFDPPAYIHAMRAVASRYAALVSAPPPPDFPLPSELVLSSLGPANAHIQRSFVGADGQEAVSVLRLGMALEMTDRQLYVLMWSWMGRLVLSLCYNDAYHDAESVSGVLESIRMRLEEGLGVAVDTVAV